MSNEVSESKFFREQRAKSLNSLQNNASTWTLTPKVMYQFEDAVLRVKMDLEEGILTKLRLQRQ